MGLDMYMFRRGKSEEVAYWRKANAIHRWLEEKLAPEEEFENCEEYKVDKDILIELRNTCQNVIDHSKLVNGKIKTGERLENNKWIPTYNDGKVVADSSYAEEVMPTTSGFFFGSTDYDEMYIEDLKETIQQIDKILEDTDFDKEEIVYMAWW